MHKKSKKIRLLPSSQVSIARAYRSKRNIKRLCVLLIFCVWEASHFQSNPTPYSFPFIHLNGKRHTESKVSCTRTQRQGLELDHQHALAIMPPRFPYFPTRFSNNGSRLQARCVLKAIPVNNACLLA